MCMCEYPQTEPTTFSEPMQTSLCNTEAESSKTYHSRTSDIRRPVTLSRSLTVCERHKRRRKVSSDKRWPPG